MGTPHPHVGRHKYIQHRFAREMALALKQHVRHLDLPTEEKRDLLHAVTFTALSVIDSTLLDEEDGTEVEAHLSFYPSESTEKRPDEAICHPHGSYLHELMPLESDEIFECGGDE